MPEGSTSFSLMYRIEVLRICTSKKLLKNQYLTQLFGGVLVNTEPYKNFVIEQKKNVPKEI